MNQIITQLEPLQQSTRESIPVAIVANAQTPYRLHLHQRIAREIPGVKLFSVYTHELSNAPWAFAAPEEIGPVSFGKGETADQQADPRNALREWRRAGRIIRWMRDQHIGFVVMMGYNDLGRLRLIRWCKKQGVPCFLFGDSNIRGDPTGTLKARIKSLILRRVLGWCSGALSCGTLGEAYFRKYGVSRIFFFPYEPDYDLIRNQPPEQIEKARLRFGLNHERRRIVYSGRLTAVKRVDLLIDAFAAIASARPDWDLLIVGAGSLQAELQAHVPAALKARVQWTGFLDDQPTVSALYRLSDVLVLPSDFEPWALVINEAAAAGLAIVASNVVGAAEELVRPGVNGRVFPPGDLAALTDALQTVTEPSRIDEMKAASAQVLADWRRRGDPIAGLKKAMQSVGILTDEKSA